MDALVSSDLLVGLMASHGYSVRSLAKAAGVSTATVQAAKAGRPVQRFTAEAIAEAFGLPWDLLFHNVSGPAPFLTVAETAQVLRSTEASVRWHIRQGHIPAKKVGRNLRIPRSFVLEAQ